MKWILCILCALFFISSADALTNTAASTSYTDVNNAVNGGGGFTALSDGDTCVVPAGTSTWASTLVVTKNITLRGASIIGTWGTTTINSSTTTLIDFQTTASHFTATLQGMTLGFTGTGYALKLHGIARFNGTDGGIRVNQIKWTVGPPGAFYKVYVSDWVTGVVDHCFYDVPVDVPAADGFMDMDTPSQPNFVGSNSAIAASTSAVTISNASPTVISWTAHGLLDGQGLMLTTTGTLPAGLSINTVYFVQVINANSFNLSLVPFGTKVNTTNAGSGTHTATACNNKPQAGFYSYAFPYKWGQGFGNDNDALVFEDCIIQKRGFVIAQADGPAAIGAGGSRIVVRHCSLWGAYSGHGFGESGGNAGIGVNEGYNNIYVLNFPFPTVPVDGNTVTIVANSSRVYTFKTALTGAANEIHINGQDGSLLNLSRAINLTGTIGTDYGTGTVINADVSANATVVSHALTLTSKVTGTGGNAYTVATTSDAINVVGAVNFHGGAIGVAAFTSVSGAFVALNTAKHNPRAGAAKYWNERYINFPSTDTFAPAFFRAVSAETNAGQVIGSSDGTNFFDQNARGGRYTFTATLPTSVTYIPYETKVAVTSDGQALSNTPFVINVDSTTNFTTTGTIYVNATDGTVKTQPVTYTGITGTSFTGCQSGAATGTIHTGNAVVGPLIIDAALSYPGGTYAPVVTQLDGSSPGVPADTRIGAVYAQGSTSTTTGSNITLTGVNGAVANQWLGFSIRNRNTSPAESTGGQGSYGAGVKCSLISSSTLSANTVITAEVGHDSSFTIGASEPYDLRFLITGIGFLGGDYLPLMNGGLLHSGDTMGYYVQNTAGQTQYFAQHAEGMWFWGNKYCPSITNLLSGSPTITTSSRTVGYKDRLIQGGVNNVAPVGFPTQNSDITTTQGQNNLKIGADWDSNTFGGVSTKGGTISTLASSIPYDNTITGWKATQAYGAVYPHPLVNGLQAPTITSNASANFGVGVPICFTFQSSGNPVPSFTPVPSPLPGGLTFTDAAQCVGSASVSNPTGGTATLSGTASAPTGTPWPIPLTAHNTQSPDGTQNFALTLSIPDTRIITVQATLNFGSTFIGIPVTGSINIKSTGNATLHETGASGQLSAFTFPTGDSVTIAAGNSASIPVTFLPLIPGSFNCVVTFASDDTSGNPVNTCTFTTNGIGPLILRKY